jgi:transposase-like protein
MQKETQCHRRRWSDEEKRVLVQRWQSSGLSAREFGEREGVRFQYLWNWKSAQSKDACARKARAAITFAPVRVKDGAELVRAEVADAQRVALELALDGGVRIRVFSGADMRAVSELVNALSRMSSC